MEWISVKDRLPEEFIDCLVCHDNWPGVYQAIYHGTCKLFVLSVPNSYRTPLDVTHWMELPKLPSK